MGLSQEPKKTYSFRDAKSRAEHPFVTGLVANAVAGRGAFSLLHALDKEEQERQAAAEGRQERRLQSGRDMALKMGAADLLDPEDPLYDRFKRSFETLGKVPEGYSLFRGQLVPKRPERAPRYKTLTDPVTGETFRMNLDTREVEPFEAPAAQGAPEGPAGTPPPVPMPDPAAGRKSTAVPMPAPPGSSRPSTAVPLPGPPGPAKTQPFKIGVKPPTERSTTVVMPGLGEEGAGLFVIDKRKKTAERVAGVGGGRIEPKPDAGFVNDVAMSQAMQVATKDAMQFFDAADKSQKGRDYLTRLSIDVAARNPFGGSLDPAVTKYYAHMKRALFRMTKSITGAAFPESELKRYESRFPKPGFETAKTAADKFEAILEEAVQDIGARYGAAGRVQPSGHGGAAPAPPAAAERTPQEEWEAFQARKAAGGS